jgi:hypothetical protein
MSDKEFVDGLIVKPPISGAPDFIKCQISIKRKDLGNWLRGKDEDWINLDVKVSRKGKWYAEVNTWKPKQSQHDQDKANGYQSDAASYEQAKNGIDDDIPF